MKIWICGQLTSEWIGRGTAWEFQGAFSTELGAIAACQDESYFIFSAIMDKSLPHAPVQAEDAYYPCCISDKEGTSETSSEDTDTNDNN